MLALFQGESEEKGKLREWSSGELSEATRLPRRTTAKILNALRRRDLVGVEPRKEKLAFKARTGEPLTRSKMTHQYKLSGDGLLTAGGLLLDRGG